MDLPYIPWYRHWWGLTAILVGAFVLISFGFFGYLVYSNYQGIKNKLSPENEIKTADPARLYGNTQSPWLGTTTPKLTIVEFSDFACPHCSATFPVIREISVKYADSVKIIFRNFPVISEHSLALSLAGYCAAEQGKFWSMHDQLFLKQGISSSEDLVALARATGLDGTGFGNCLSDQRHIALIQKDVEDGQALGVTGTPTWFFNGLKVEGEIPRVTFLKIVEGFLNKE